MVLSVYVFVSHIHFLFLFFLMLSVNNYLDLIYSIYRNPSHNSTFPISYVKLPTSKPFAILTQSFIRYSVHSQDEVIFKDDISHDGEEVDQDESQYSGQNDGAAVPGDALDDVQQRLFSVDQVKELRRVT